MWKKNVKSVSDQTWKCFVKGAIGIISFLPFFLSVSALSTTSKSFYENNTTGLSLMIMYLQIKCFYTHILLSEWNQLSLNGYKYNQ